MRQKTKKKKSAICRLPSHNNKFLGYLLLVSKNNPFNHQPPTSKVREEMVVLRHKKILELAKGFRGRGNSCYKIAVNRVEKALQYAYRDRKVRKREFRSLWIQRINASVRMFDLTYGNFIFGAQKSNIELDRKILADLAVSEPLSFRAVVDTVKTTSGIKK